MFVHEGNNWGIKHALANRRQSRKMIYLIGDERCEESIGLTIIITIIRLSNRHGWILRVHACGKVRLT